MVVARYDKNERMRTMSPGGTPFEWRISSNRARFTRLKAPDMSRLRIEATFPFAQAARMMVSM